MTTEPNGTNFRIRTLANFPLAWNRTGPLPRPSPRGACGAPQASVRPARQAPIVRSRGWPGGIFLRCAGTTDHYNVLLQQRGRYLGFQHVAYEFRDFDEVMLLGAHMEARGWRTNVGPLRHNIGSSLSWYIWNPAGGLAEAYCDMDSAGDDWQVRTFDPGDPSFYGHSWNARPEQSGRRPADLHDD